MLKLNVKYYNKIIKLQGVTFPAMHIMIAKWAPPNERSVLASIVYAGKIQFLLIEIKLFGIFTI